MRANLFKSRWFLATSLTAATVALTAEAKEPAVTAATTASATQTVPAPDGRELFTREWLPNDSRAHGGDGLGPVYNDSSCIACHNQGGIGGGGAAGKNVDIITAFPISAGEQNASSDESKAIPEALFNTLFGSLAPPVEMPPAPKPPEPTAEEKKATKERVNAQLARIHPGFLASRSIVLHHFGTDPKYQQWRAAALSGDFENLNPTPLEDAPPFNTEVQPGTPVPAGRATEAPRPAATAKPAGLDPGNGPAASGPPVESSKTEAVRTQTPSAADPNTPSHLWFPVSAEAQIKQLRDDVRISRNGMLGATNRFGEIQISRSQRNATALFGVGLIDSIPEQAIRDIAKQEAEKYPTVAGRPSKQKGGRIGRFGWKAQKSTLEDFAMTACAVELGLNVPGHEQAGLALQPDYKAPGLDMNQAECDALVKFLKELPAPAQRRASNAQEAAYLDAGSQQFVSVGCAHCHVQKVGAVDGLYSDLLLHDMGPELGDTGAYGVFKPNSPEEEQQEPLPMANAGSTNPDQQPKLTAEQLSKVVGALRQEWRTPPLWGVRDSGPYLHDGRAETLEQAIALHGGQASASAVAFFQLKPAEQQQVIAFLKSLTAPEEKVVMGK